MPKRAFNIFVLVVLLITATSPSCKISYSFTGANISPDVKTYSVAYFPNRAKLINPVLSQEFTEALKDKLQRQTSLNEVKEIGDLEYSGTITNYEVRPISIQKGDVASQNRLTITINLKYTNNKEHEQDFERSFSAFEDYDSTKILSEVEDDLVGQILDKLLDDIFNSTIANW